MLDPRSCFSDPGASAPGTTRRRKLSEPAALRELAQCRAELLQELSRLVRSPDYLRGQAPDQCCHRRWNQMRITPLEARAIADAFERDSRLRARLPAVVQRLRAELPQLRDNGERQNFECPLLEEGRCLVHESAKPIGCLAWHPAPPSAADGREHYTELGWNAFARRDGLNDAVYGDSWKSRVIPLWLRRVFAPWLARTADDV